MPLAPKAQETSLNDGDLNISLGVSEDLGPALDIRQNRIPVLRLNSVIAIVLSVAHTGNDLDAIRAVDPRKLLEVLDDLGLVVALDDLDVHKDSAG